MLNIQLLLTIIIIIIIIIITIRSKFDANNQGTNVLTISNILSNTFKLAQKYGLKIVFLSILWLLTIWIPYINVGTTIALWGLCIAIGKNEEFTIDDLFSAKYRKPMGDFFLLYGMIIVGTMVGFLFLFIPGIVIGIAWSQAIYLLIDKNLNPMEAIKKSNEITYGEKWNIIGGYLILYFSQVALLYVLMGIAYTIAPVFMILIIPINIVLIVCMVCCSSYIYSELSKKLN